MRKHILLHDNWLFHRGDIEFPAPPTKGPVYSQSKTERKLTGPASYTYKDSPDPYWMRGTYTNERWERVTIPHDYVVDQDNDPNENNALGYLHYDNAWYRHHFHLPEGTKEGDRVLLRFDGIAGESTIYLNGCLMTHNHSTYNTFEVDISDYVYFDRENIIAVYVNKDEFEGWWYGGAGIYRDVHLTVTAALAIDLYGVFAPARRLDEHRWQIDFETTAVNAGFSDATVRVTSEVIDAAGNCVATACGEGLIPLRDRTSLRYSAIVEDPALWSPDHPALYTVRTTLTDRDEPLDEDTTRIGFRTVEISPEEGLRINGKQTIIKGVCAHQDFGLTGLAVPDNILRYKMELIREMGANGFRTAHYQHPAAAMDAMDELGFLVMDEARWFESTEESLKQLEALVKRDRNRPSVIFWSTGNEEPHFITDVGRRIHRALAARIRQLDPTRYITAAEDKSPEKSTIYGDCDVVGINYNLNIYDKVHELCPDQAIFASECCATGTTRDWHYPSENKGRIRDKDRDTNNWFLGRERTWKFLMSRPYVIGGYQWAAVEHRGEATWPAVCSKSGALDLFLQKKGAFYQNLSHWSEKPMAHIVPHWNFRGLEDEEITVTVYTNCEELELFLNGKSLGCQTIERYGHGEWNVPYVPGKLEVIGRNNGEIAARHARETTGRAERLRLTADNSFTANGRDLALFTCECLDAEGRVVPDAAEFVQFSVEEPAVIIGTGSDHCDHIHVSAHERKMYMGKIRIAVKPAKGQQRMVLTAMSDHCGVTKLVTEISQED